MNAILLNCAQGSMVCGLGDKLESQRNSCEPEKHNNESIENTKFEGLGTVDHESTLGGSLPIVLHIAVMYYEPERIGKITVVESTELIWKLQPPMPPPQIIV